LSARLKARPSAWTRHVQGSVCKGKELRDTPRGTLAIELLRRWRKVRVTGRRTVQDFVGQLGQLVDEDYPDVEQIVLVADNLNIHSPACLYKRFASPEARRIAAKIEWHHTPEHGSWLNIAECELSVIHRQCLARRIADRQTLAQEVRAWKKERNQARIQIDWQFTTQDARIELRRLYPVIKGQNSS